MNKKILKTLEYDAVKTQIKPFLSTVAGEKELRDLLPTSNAQKMQQWLAETAEESVFQNLQMLSPICNAYESTQH